MKVPIIKIYQSSRQDMSHYIFRTQDANIQRTIEEYVNNLTPVGVVHEYMDSFSNKDVANVSMTIDENPIGYPDFTAFSLPFEFNIPNTNYKIELKNNVGATDVITYTIYLGITVISKIEENIGGVDTTLTTAEINDNFKIVDNALLIKSSLCNYKLATFYGTIKVFDFLDDGTQVRPDVLAYRAHGVYTPVLTTIEASDYISFYQEASTRKNIYYYNVLSKTHEGYISEMSQTRVCEISEDSPNMQFILESSDDYFQMTTPTWSPISTGKPIEEIKINKIDLVSKIIPIDNFKIFANDDKLRLENMRELRLTNIWNSTNRKLMNRDKKAFRAINKCLAVSSQYSDVITFDNQEEILIDKIVIYKKNVSGMLAADMSNPIEMTDVDASVIKVFIRQGGIYYQDFFINPYSTNKDDDYFDYDSDYNKVEIPDYLVTSVTLDSRFPLLKIKDGCIYGNKYNYTIYLFDEFGKTSEPITVVL